MTDEQLSAVHVGTRVLFNDLGVHDGCVFEISPSGGFYLMLEIDLDPGHAKWIHKDKIIEVLPGGARAQEERRQVLPLLAMKKQRTYKRETKIR